MGNSAKTYRVEGMHCAGCVASVEKSLNAIDGVQSATVNLPLENVRINFVQELPFVKLKDELQSAGYTLVDEPPQDLSAQKEKDIADWRRRFIWATILGSPLLIFAMWEMMASGEIGWQSILLQFCLVAPIIFISRQFYINGFTALAHRNPNMNSLVALGTGAAILYSLISSVNILFQLGITGFEKLYFESAGVILVFITMGRFLEARAKYQTTRALLELFDRAPKTGFLKKGDQWVEVPVIDIQQGDKVMIKPGGQIPVDGIVVEGSSFVNESAITGEPIPIEKTEGDALTGATINTSGVLIMEAQQVGGDTIFSRIIQLVEQAQNSKAPIQSLADKVAAVFVPVVLILAIVSFSGWLLIGQSLVFAFNIFISVLIIACPCALGLATPTAMVVGTGLAADLGIHFKSAEALQNLSEIATIFFDKTGTLTLGKPKVVEFKTDIAENEFIMKSASLEKGSEHPLADAIMKLAEDLDIQTSECQNFQAVSGKGIQGDVDGKTIQIGTLKWLNNSGVKLPLPYIEKLAEWEKNGYTIIHVASVGEWIGMVAISDTLRKDSKIVIQQLKQNSVSTHLLTGDRITSGEFIAHKIGIKIVHAELLPKDKAEKISEMRASGMKVAMVGDGINDAPALATADVGISIGSGTDVALETSDVVLMRDDLTSVVNALQLSKRVVNKIKQNLFWAFAYNVVGIPIAMGLLYPISGYLLNPMLAGVAMAFSSVSVVGNTLLLRKR
ncbi:MAG: copper-translocating P-type ATPase [Candidatus Marinimicrobia bacterium]|nr:copper-translocating P-type ATPase [Candidatus Neomarinimicrobiota bacterium]